MTAIIIRLLLFCLCYAIPILKTQEEFWSLDEDKPSVNEVTDVPEGFRDWVRGNSERIGRAEKRGTLPYFIRDNREVVDKILKEEQLKSEGGSGKAEDRRALIEERRKEYERLKADPNYTDVAFNPENGGLKATHVGHIVHSSTKEPTFFGEEHLTSTALELECQQELFKQGHKCLLLEEGIKTSDGNILPALDANIDGVVMDIRAITVSKEHYGAAIMAKVKQLNRYNAAYVESRDTICLYFHEAEMYSSGCIENGLKWIKDKIGKEKVNALKQILVVRKGLNDILVIKCAASE